MQAQEDRRSAMLDLARRWRESGAKARVFAQEHGITAWTLYYWRQRLAQEERPARRRRRSPRRVWVLCTRLGRGTVAWPGADRGEPVAMRSADPALLLSGVDVAQTRRRRWYERVA